MHGLSLAEDGDADDDELGLSELADDEFDTKRFSFGADAVV
jgi:hypothetical protein